MKRFTAGVCAALMACGAPQATKTGARAVAHEGPRNDALRAASAKHGVPLELLMAVAMHQGRFEPPPVAEDAALPEPATALETVVPPPVEPETMPEPEAFDPEAPLELDPVVALAPDETDLGLQAELTDDTVADDPEAVSDPVSEAIENQTIGDAHADAEVFGLMYLTGEQVTEAARLTGASELQLRTSLALNVDGAAALLEHYAVIAHVDPASEDLAAWTPAIAKFLGADGDDEITRLAMKGLEDLYLDGFDLTTEDGERVGLDGIGRDVGTAQQQLTPGQYPPIQFIPAASTNYGSRQGGTVRFVVIHDMEGTLAGTIAVFRNPGRQASAHYNMRARDGHIVQMVPESKAAWHSGHAWFNHNSIGIEHEGFADRVNGGGFYTATQYKVSSQLTCAIAKKYRIPVDRKHIFGHGNVPPNTASRTLCSDANANAGRCGGASRHHDPGRFWNWTTYMRLVARCVANKPVPPTLPKPPPAPAGTTVKGVVYKGTNPAAVIAGATVKLGTKTATTNASGFYQLTGIPAGTRTITASKAGYVSKSVTRAVAGKETWGSLGLSPVPPSGTAKLIGVVTRGSARVAGAKITLSNGRTTTTNADGVYRFSGLAPATLKITASKSGLGSASVSRDVKNGAEVWGSVKL